MMMMRQCQKLSSTETKLITNLYLLYFSFLIHKQIVELSFNHSKVKTKEQSSSFLSSSSVAHLRSVNNPRNREKPDQRRSIKFEAYSVCRGLRLKNHYDSL